MFIIQTPHIYQHTAKLLQIKLSNFTETCFIVELNSVRSMW